jgi:type IV secretion system protein VirB5
MNTRLLALAGALGVLAAAPAHAQFGGSIVSDPGAYSRMVLQLNQAKAQLQQLQAQVQQGRQLLDSLNVNSQVNRIASQLSTPELRQFLPDMSSFEAPISGNFSGLGNLGARASQIRAANRIYAPAAGASPSDADKFFTDSLEQSGDRAARDMALGESVGNVGAQRLQGLQQLQQSLDGATDARAVLDIQARIGAESAMIQNDQMRLQGMAMVQQAQDRLQAQRDREAARKSTEDAEAAFRKVIQQ